MKTTYYYYHNPIISSIPSLPWSPIVHLHTLFRELDVLLSQPGRPPVSMSNPSKVSHSRHMVPLKQWDHIPQKLIGMENSMYVCMTVCMYVRIHTYFSSPFIEQFSFWYLSAPRFYHERVPLPSVKFLLLCLRQYSILLGLTSIFGAFLNMWVAM